MVEKIKKLKNKKTFYDDVRALLGNRHYPDHTIKKLQRIADARYKELEERGKK